MFDRGPYFDEVKKTQGIDWPEGWDDPDANYYAEPVETEKNSVEAA